MINVAVAGKRYRYSSGVSLVPKDWNHYVQEVRNSEPTHLAIMKRLGAIRSELNQAYHGLSFGADGNVVSAAELKKFDERIRQFLEDGADAKGMVLPAFAKFIDKYTLSHGRGQITNERPSEYSLKRYRLVKNTLEEYANKFRTQLTFDSIDEEFYRRFVGWLTSDRGITDAAVGNYIKVLKTFMKWAKDRKMHNNRTYEIFHKPNPVADTIALSAKELRLLRDADLTDSSKLSRVRDHFLIQTFTALRYGDLITLEPKHFDFENGFIVLPAKKTEVRTVIPIIRPLLEVLKRYPSLMFEFNSGVKANKYLKELGKRVGLKSPVTISEYRGGKRFDQTVPKYTQLTTHVARRSFVTISLEFGLSESIIRKVTGHKTSDVMDNHYVKITPEMVGEMVYKAWGKL